MESVVETFARAVASKDTDRLREIVAPQVSFMGMTPYGLRLGESNEDVIGILGDWFGADDNIEDIEALESDSFADRHRVGYRLRVKNPSGTYLVDQTAYMSIEAGRISWLRIMCAGYRRTDN